MKNLNSKSIITMLCFALGGTTCSKAQTSTTLSYNGSDKVIKNPERGLSYKAGYVDLFVDGYSYDGAVSYQWTHEFPNTANTTPPSFISRFRKDAANHLQALPIGYKFKSTAPSGLITVDSDLDLPLQGNDELQISFPSPMNSSYDNSSDLVIIHYTDNTANSRTVKYKAFSSGVAGNYNGGYGDFVAPGNNTIFSKINIRNISGVGGQIQSFYIFQNDDIAGNAPLNIDMNEPVILELRSDIEAFTINHIDRSGVLESRIECSSPHIEQASDQLNDFEIRTELSYNQIPLDISTETLSTSFGNQITYNSTNHTLNFTDAFFDTQTYQQGSQNDIELDQCYMEENGISLVELEEYIHFSEENITAPSPQYQLESVSINRTNNAFNQIKSFGLKAHQVTNSDFKMTANNHIYNVPDDAHFTYLQNIMDETNAEIYSVNNSLVALNTLGWIKDQEDASLYRLSPTWLKTSKDKHYLHSGQDAFYSEYLPNEENTLRSSHQRSLFRYSAAAFNPNFTGNGFNSSGIGAHSNIQHYQETVMKKVKNYFPNKKMLTDMVVAWEHKFTYPQNGGTYDDAGEDEFDVNPNLGYYDDMFATTYEYLGTICDEPQFNSVSADFTSDGKKDLFVLGKFSNNFWMHADMPLYFDDATFGQSFGAMAGNWTNNGQFDYEALKGMLTASDDEQNPFLAAKKLFRFNYTSFDVTYNNSEDIGKNIFEFVEPNGNGAIDIWKETSITQALADQYQLPYSTGYFTHDNKSVFDYIRDHLGYRLELQNLETTVQGNNLKAKFHVQNRGFSAPKNPRQIYAVLLNESGQQVQSNPVNIDENGWLYWTTDANLDNKKSQVTGTNYTDYTLDANFDPINYNTHTVQATFDMSGLTTNTNYSIALWMPDPSTGLNTASNQVDYAVKLANRPISIGARGENIVASFKRGVNQMNLPSKFTSANTLMINQDATWSSLTEHNRDITIPNGRTLTITGTLKMPQGTKIQVQKGGKLIVDGGTITSNCNAPWMGIEVFADDNLNQLISSGQGKVELKNNARIEYAVDGVALIGHTQNGDIAWGTSGGILLAENTTFYNCRRGIEFMAYTNYNSNYTTERRNKGTLTNCTFKFTDEFNSLYGYNAYGENYYPVGISMWEVDRVIVKGCTFINEMTTFNTNHVAHNKYDGHGIICVDASPKIQPVYSSNTIPATATDWNSFEGFDIGVYKVNLDGGTSPIKIKDNNLSDNRAGIYIENSPFTTVVLNDINVPNLSFGTTTDHVKAVGIYLNGASDFEVEENTFVGNGASSTHHDGGLIVENMYATGPHNVNVYNNTFDKLGFGFLAYGENGDSYTDNGVPTSRGLELGCNDFGQDDNNYQDWYIHNGAFISPVQGSGSTPTGNRFSDNPITADNYGHIFIGGTSFEITEYFRFNSDEHNPIESDNAKVAVTNTGSSFSESENCPSNLSQGGVITGSNVIQHYSHHELVKSQLVLLKTNYKNTLNGGLRPEIMDVLLDEDKTSKEVRDMLINGSPYLDDGILIAAINREIPLTQWHLTEVLVWNSKLSRKVLNALYETQPLTPYQFNLVKNADNGSQRLLLELDIHEKQMELARLQSDHVLKAWETDDVNFYDEVIKVYDNEETEFAVGQCIEAELSKKNYIGATSRLNTFMGSNSNADFQTFYNFKINLKQSGRNWFQLSDNEVKVLDDLQASNHWFIAPKVENIKRFISGENKTFTPLPIDLTQPQAKQAYVGKPSDESFENILEMKYLSGEQTLMFISTKPGGRFTIVNALGQVVETGEIANVVEYKDVSYLQSGVYHIRLTSDEVNKTQHDKFVVQ